MSTLIIALRVALLTLLLTGIAYPLVTTGVARVIFPRQSQGSLVSDESGQVVGSELLAQGFSRPSYFQPRLSLAGEKGYDATASAGSSFGTTSRKLRERVDADIARLQRENPDAPGAVPVELVTASASGLDPEISPEAARWQVARVAKARGIAAERVRSVVDAVAEGRELGVLGEPRVNVLLLNLALDRQFGRPAG
jgi:K+-transporting ATPase ATPase C chain